MASNTDDIGSDEATEGMQDLCAYCVDKGKPQPATKFCFDCGPFGRYICGMCVQNHNYFTSGHIVKSLSDAVSHGRRKYVDVQTEKNYIEESKYVKELEAKKKAERLLEENIKNTEDLKKEIKLKEAEIAKKSKERSDLERNKGSEISRIRSEKNPLEKEKEELLTSLSAMAGRKLEDNNPNIADLSDMNRPTKLAEKFSELYDNTWTDAFSSIQELDGYKDNEEKAIMALMNMLTTAYKVASDAAEKELTSLKEKIEQFHGSSDEKLVKDVMKPLMDSRKKRVKPTVELKHAYQSEVV